jgi:hypothetical protein
MRFVAQAICPNVAHRRIAQLDQFDLQLGVGLFLLPLSLTNWATMPAIGN